MTSRTLFETSPRRRRPHPDVSEHRPGEESIGGGIALWLLMVLGLAIWGGGGLMSSPSDAASIASAECSGDGAVIWATVDVSPVGTEARG